MSRLFRPGMEVSVLPIALVALVALLISMFMPFMARTRDEKGYSQAWTRSRLATIHKAIQIVELESKSAACPATTLRGLVDWLGANDWVKQSAEHLGIDLRNKTILDYWKQPIHLILRDGRLEALGSAGKNRAWEDGQGDDIVVPITPSDR